MYFGKITEIEPGFDFTGNFINDNGFQLDKIPHCKEAPYYGVSIEFDSGIKIDLVPHHGGKPDYAKITAADGNYDIKLLIGIFSDNIFSAFDQIREEWRACEESDKCRILWGPNYNRLFPQIDDEEYDE